MAPDSIGWRAIRPVDVVSATVAVLGLAVSTVATSLAFGAGEVPVTLLPFGRSLAALGLIPLAAARAGSVVLLWVALDRWVPSARPGTVAAAGVGWALWGVWQAWLLLART